MPRAQETPPRVADVPVKARGCSAPQRRPRDRPDLVRLGISDPKQLRKRDPDRMYEALCRIDGVRHDPCLLDVFTSVVAFVNGAPARPWWAYTPKRKARRQPTR
jgi:hypothetical protein